MKDNIAKIKLNQKQIDQFNNLIEDFTLIKSNPISHNIPSK